MKWWVCTFTLSVAIYVASLGVLGQLFVYSQFLIASSIMSVGFEHVDQKIVLFFPTVLCSRSGKVRNIIYLNKRKDKRYS